MKNSKKIIWVPKHSKKNYDVRLEQVCRSDNQAILLKYEKIARASVN